MFGMETRKTGVFGWRSGLAAVVLLAMQGFNSAHAVVIINYDSSVTDLIPGVSSFTTGGDDMAGMTVRAVFDTGLDETLAWSTSGADSGGVSGADWSLAFTGASTFNGSWVFTNLTGGSLQSLTLDGQPGLTVFDVCGDNDIFCQTPPACDDIPGNCGTFGSALGITFFTDAGSPDVVATYSQQVALTGEAAVGDLWHVLNIEFIDALRDREWAFFQDTDNDIRVETPAPSVLALMGIGLVSVALFRRRARV